VGLQRALFVNDGTVHPPDSTMVLMELITPGFGLGVVYKLQRVLVVPGRVLF